MAGEWPAGEWAGPQQYWIHDQDEADGHGDELNNFMRDVTDAFRNTTEDLNNIKDMNAQIDQELKMIKETHAQMQQQMTQAAVDAANSLTAMTAMLQEIRELQHVVHDALLVHLIGVGHSSSRPPAPPPPAAVPLVPAAAWPPAIPAAACGTVGDPWWIIAKGQWQSRYCLLCGSAFFDVCCFIYCI